MGAVYEALHGLTGKTVALKLMRVGLASPEARSRLRREARILGGLQHSGIAQILDADTVAIDGELLPYFAMELVRGGRNILQHAAALGLGLRDRLSLFARVCDAVQHGHEQAIIHRDLKPANILVTP